MGMGFARQLGQEAGVRREMITDCKSGVPETDAQRFVQ
jgi:hypothetical protein